MVVDFVNLAKPFRLVVFLFGCLSLLACCACVGVLFFDPADYEPYVTWHAIGPVQVLGGQDEVWVFAEKRVMISVPGRFVSAPVRTKGHHQEVVIFDAKGAKDRIVIPDMGPTFHSNIGKIFRQADGFYLIEGESMFNYRSMYRWRKNHFALMPLVDSEEWLRKQGLDTIALPEFDPAIDKITEANGWKHLYDDKAQLLLKEGPFVWNNRRLKFKAEQAAMTTYSVGSSRVDLQACKLEYSIVSPK